MKHTIQIQLAMVLCSMVCAFSSCDDNEDLIVDTPGTYYHLLKAKDNAFAVEEKDGEFHVNVPAQGGTYEFVFNPEAYYVMHDGKEKKVRLDKFNFIIWECFDEAIYCSDFEASDNPNTEENMQNFLTKNNRGLASLDCFFGRFEGLINRCIVTVKANNQNRDRNLRIVFSTFPMPEAHIVLHQAAD